MADEAAGDVARPGRIVIQHHAELGRQQRIGAERAAGERGVRGGDHVGMRAGGALGRERQHLGAERGQAQLVGRHAGLRETVEERAHLRQRLGPGLADQRPVADAEAEHDPRPPLGRLPGEPGGDLGGLVLPDVEDAAGDPQVLGGVEQPVDRGEDAVVDAARNPRRAIAELLDQPRRLGAFVARREAHRSGPDADAAEVEGFGLHGEGFLRGVEGRLRAVQGS